MGVRCLIERIDGIGKARVNGDRVKQLVERDELRTLHIAEGLCHVVAVLTSLKPYPLTITAGRDHVDALSSALADFGGKVRAAIDAADGRGDKDTADLFTEISREVDKDVWFLEAHLHGER